MSTLLVAKPWQARRTQSPKIFFYKFKLNGKNVLKCSIKLFFGNNQASNDNSKQDNREIKTFIAE